MDRQIVSTHSTITGPKPLTERERDLYAAVVAYKRAHDGNSPTLRQLCAICEISSTSLVSTGLKRLQQAHLIQVEPGTKEICVEGGRWTLDS